jgi:hypothetical protein
MGPPQHEFRRLTKVCKSAAAAGWNDYFVWAVSIARKGNSMVSGLTRDNFIGFFEVLRR